MAGVRTSCQQENMLSLLETLALGATLVACLAVVGAIYRLYLSPLADVPGPRLAALTYFYEFYYDLVVGARFPWQLEKLHCQYGAVLQSDLRSGHQADKGTLIQAPSFASPQTRSISMTQNSCLHISHPQVNQTM